MTARSAPLRSFDGVTLVPLGGHGPEDVLVDGEGRVHTGLGVPAPRAPQLGRIQALPGPVRTLVTKLPPRLQPRADPRVSVVAVDDDGRVVHELRGRIEGVSLLTGVRERPGRLWLGSLEGGVIGTLDIAAG